MDPQILAAIITVLLTALAGAGGYLIKGWLYASKPFIRIINVDGGFTRGADREDIPEPIVSAISKVPATLINPLSSTDSLAEVYSSRRDAHRYVHRAQEFLDYLADFDRCVVASDNRAATSTLIKILGGSEQQMWLTPLIGDNVVEIPDADKSLPPKIPFGESTQNNGSIWIGFPGGGIVFGRELSILPAFKMRLIKFSELVERLEFDKLRTVFGEIRQSVEVAQKVAKDVLPLLDKVVNESSQWAVRLYVANISQSPFLVNQIATLHVIDSNGASYEEPCYLVLVSKRENGAEAREPATTPLVLRSESDATFEFFTTNTQRSMKRGDAFRDAFDKGSAQCWVDLSIERHGLGGSKSMSTHRGAFKSSAH